jgi:flagellar basal body-associated protein FliL
MEKKKKSLIIAAVIIILIILCPLAFLSPYKGKVIDTETKEPIEGAVVLVVYYSESPTIAGSSVQPADAQEAVTDSNGEFNFSLGFVGL